MLVIFHLTDLDNAILAWLHLGYIKFNQTLIVLSFVCFRIFFTVYLERQLKTVAWLHKNLLLLNYSSEFNIQLCLAVMYVFSSYTHRHMFFSASFVHICDWIQRLLYSHLPFFFLQVWWHVWLCLFAFPALNLRLNVCVCASGFVWEEGMCSVVYWASAEGCIFGQVPARSVDGRVRHGSLLAH